MQTLKHCAVIFKEPWPMGPMATPVTPSMSLSRLPFYVSLSLWAEDSKQCPHPHPCSVFCDTLERGCEGCCSHKGGLAVHLPW